MDLTSGFYNIPMCEEDKKYTAFTTPVGLYEPKDNFTSLLCYLDDLLVFTPTEEVALNRLQKFRGNNLKLSPKKCHLMQRTVKCLRHVTDQNGMAVDPEK